MNINPVLFFIIASFESNFSLTKNGSVDVNKIRETVYDSEVKKVSKTP